MSPEQARGLAVDKRTDIWAFGCVLYEMLTRRVAFAGDTVSDTIAKILEREPDWISLPIIDFRVVFTDSWRAVWKRSKTTTARHRRRPDGLDCTGRRRPCQAVHDVISTMGTAFRGGLPRPSRKLGPSAGWSLGARNHLHLTMASLPCDRPERGNVFSVVT
jgi:serine/threonine protein kinase